MKVVTNFYKYIIIFGLTIFLSCEDMYESEKEYIDCSWFQYAEQQIFNCEDVSWCDESQFPNEKVRKAWIFYTGNMPEEGSAKFLHLFQTPETPNGVDHPE